MDHALEPDLERLAVLAEPARRRLYLYVAPRADAVGRDEAAQAVGVSRALAAFHLDRLVEEGLLQTEFRRLTGRSGPGAGRPSKLYRRARRELAVSLPKRSYELAARLFATALDDGTSGPPDPRERLRAAAHEYGKELGAAARDLATDDRGGGEVGALTRILADAGFEPRAEGGSIRLGNCPFHALATSHRNLTCGTNLALLDGVLAGLGATELTATQDPQPGLCCVHFSPANEERSTPAMP